MKLHDLQVGQRITSRMRIYIAAKMNCDDHARKARAEGTCRSWLKHMGWFRLSHSERHKLFCVFYKPFRKGSQLNLFDYEVA